MNLGFFTMPIHPLDKDWRLSLQEDREAFLLADELGFTEAYVGEHVTDKAENITSCIAFIAWIAAATKKIRLGTGTINMPNTHPATVAASIAMLDHMLDGRLIFGISPGGLAVGRGIVRQSRRRPQRDVSRSDQPGAGDLGQRAAVQSSGQILEHLDAKDPDRAISARDIIARPLQRPHPPIVVTAVAPFSKGVTEAAARGWDPISANFLMPAWVKSHWPKYVEGCERGGRAGRACELARRQERLCRQGCGDGKGLRHRSGRALRLLLSFAVHQAEDERPHRAVQDAPRPARR